jgi:hypothetical protein
MAYALEKMYVKSFAVINVKVFNSFATQSLNVSSSDNIQQKYKNHFAQIFNLYSISRLQHAIYAFNGYKRA